MVSAFICWLDSELEPSIAQVGGKAFRLAVLTRAGFPCPIGFCVKALAFRVYLETSDLGRRIEFILQGASRTSVDCSQAVAELIDNTPVPEVIQEPIIAAHRDFQAQTKPQQPLAVRSSALVEDGNQFSFAGQFDSFLGVTGETELLEGLRNCWKSLYSARAISYSRRHGLTSASLQMAVLIQRLLFAQSAGVMFTSHPTTGERNLIAIEAILGIGAPLVSGQITPDTYIVDKDKLEVMQQHIARKDVALVSDEHGAITAREITSKLRTQSVLSQEQVLALAQLGVQIEAIFGGPQDIEWAIEDGHMFVVQSRPITSRVST